MLLGLLLVIQIVVCVALVGVILLQRSEGGALGMGGGSGGFMTARGAGDLLTRTTAILATIFFVLSIVLTIISGKERGGASVVDRLKVDALNPDALRPAQPAAPAGSPPAQPGAPAAPATPNVFEAPRPEVNTAPGVTPAAPPPPQIFGVPAAPPPVQPPPQPAPKQ